MMLPNPQFDESRIVNEAVARAVNPSAPSRFSGAGQGASASPPGGTTVPIEDGDNILDGHHFLTELDETEDISALTS